MESGVGLVIVVRAGTVDGNENVFFGGQNSGFRYVVDSSKVAGVGGNEGGDGWDGGVRWLGFENEKGVARRVVVIASVEE